MTRRRTPREAAWLLVTRGLVLVALEMTVVRWGWYFNLDYRHTSPQILWAIGVSMIGMAPLVWLPSRVVGAIGIAVVALHNLFGPALSARVRRPLALGTALRTGARPSRSRPTSSSS